MFYRVRFSAGCEEIVIELKDCKYTVLVKDLIEAIKVFFKIKNSSLLVFDDKKKPLCETDIVFNGKLYILKRTPPR